MFWPINEAELMQGLNYKILICAFLILVGLNILVWWAIGFGSRYPEWDFLNVGQGDASLLKFPNSGKILLDAGPDQSILDALGRSQPFFDRNLDVLILSHANLDHYAGLFYVLEHYQPRLFVYNGLPSPSATFQNLLEILKMKQIPIIEISAGDKIKIGNNQLTVISPNGQAPKSSDININSLIIKGQINNFEILLLGDAEANSIAQLTNDLKSNIVKISHHGSKNGTSERLLNLIAPEIALIGVGKENRFGHPAPTVIDLLKKSGTNVFRTDEDGNIKIIFEPELKLIRNY